MFTEKLFSPFEGLHYRYTIAIRGYAKDWTVTGPQDQLRSGLIGPPSSFAGLNYYLFVLNIKIQLVWRTSFNRNQLVWLKNHWWRTNRLVVKNNPEQWNQNSYRHHSKVSYIIHYTPIKCRKSTVTLSGCNLYIWSRYNLKTYGIFAFSMADFDWYCTSTIVQFIFYFGPLRSVIIFWEIRNKWLV